MGSRVSWVKERLDGMDKDRSGIALDLLLTINLSGLAALALIVTYDLPVALALAAAAIGIGPLALYDYQFHRLPNPATASAAGVGMAAAGILALTGQVNSLWPVVAGGTGFLAIAILEALPRNSIGGGDAKLIGALGLWTGILGWTALLPTLLGIHLLMVIGLLIGRARQNCRVAMGPWIAIGAVGSWALLGLLA